MSIRALPCLLFALALVAPATDAFAGRFPEAPHIYVNGIATETLSPDFVRVEFAVERTGTDVAASKQQVDAISDQVWQAAAGLGVERSDFEATGFSVSPVYDYEQGRPQYRGTQVSRRFTVKLREPADFEPFSEKLVQAGVQNLGGVTVDVDRRDQREAALRIEALQHARSEAERLAGALGQALTGVWTISDTPIGDGGGIPMPMAKMAMASPAGHAPTLPESVQLRAEAWVVFLTAAK